MTRDWTYADCMNQMVKAMRAFAAVGPATLPRSEAERVMRTLDAADSIGPVLHPSEWMAATDLDRQKKLVSAYLRLCQDLAEIFPDDQAREVA